MWNVSLASTYALERNEEMVLENNMHAAQPNL